MPGAVLAIETGLPDLQARATAIASAMVTPPTISFAANIQVALDAIASMQEAVALGISPPSLSAQVAIMAAALAELQVSLNVLLGLSNALGVAGVHLYQYSGPVNLLGAEVYVALAGGFPDGAPSDHADALLVATSIPAAWAAIATMMKTV
jgi:hypothetical protein